MREISGKQLYYAFAAGGRQVISQREDLNKLNVYPVPDGDTGSNLSFTLKSIIEQTKIFSDAGKTMQSLAEAALSGARGNSGILFAQFVNGMAEKLHNASHISLEAFTVAVQHAATCAYGAISNPVEGTMLTVMKDFAECLKDIQAHRQDFTDMLATAMKQVRESLAATKDKLEVLRKANVIDAGAKGFVAFLEGFHNFIAQGARVDDLADENSSEVHFTASAEHHEELDVDEDLSYRYCTEGFISGSDIDLESVREALSGLGDSLIVAGSSRSARIHIHSNEPDQVFHTLRDFGEIQEQKADDMHRQYQMVHARKSEIALVVDSTCDLPEGFMDEHQIYEVPLMLNFGDVQYLDGLTIKPEKFYQLLESERDFPRTSQPNAKTFSRLFDHLTSHYTSVISISMSSALSGTYNSSVQAASNFEGAKISTVDTLETAAAYGLIVRNAAKDIENGLSHEDVVKNIIDARKRSHTFVFARNLKNFVRGGRVSRMKGLIGNLLGVKPFISVSEEGKAIFIGKAFSRAGCIRKIIASISELRKERGIQNLAIVHGHSPEEAQEIAAAITQETGIVPDYVDEITPVLGAHGGQGAFDIAVITER